MKTGSTVNLVDYLYLTEIVKNGCSVCYVSASLSGNYLLILIREKDGNLSSRIYVYDFRKKVLKQISVKPFICNAFWFKENIVVSYMDVNNEVGPCFEEYFPEGDPVEKTNPAGIIWAIGQKRNIYAVLQLNSTNKISPAKKNK